MPQDAPVTYVRGSALMKSSVVGDLLPFGEYDVSGIAWSVFGAISSVAVSDDNGASWMNAELIGENRVGLRVMWRLRYVVRGDVTLLVRATDTAGNVQPMESVENSLGYGN